MGYKVPFSRRGRPPRRLRIALTLTGVTAFVCCVGATGLGAWNFQHVRRSAGPARQAADEFLRDVTTGDTAGAYDRLCAATRTRWSRDEFIRRLTVPPTITGYDIMDVAVATKSGELRGTVTAKLIRHSGVVDRRALPLVKDGADWRVCGDPF